MRLWIVALLVLCSGLVLAAEKQLSFAEAKKMWQQSKDRKEYQTYASEFAQFNNHFRLDEKGGCYALARGPVELMLVITHPAGGKYAVVTDVLSDVDNPKAQCFKGSYRGVETKNPPFLPFILQMSMG